MFVTASRLSAGSFSDVTDGGGSVEGGMITECFPLLSSGFSRRSWWIYASLGRHVVTRAVSASERNLRRTSVGRLCTATYQVQGEFAVYSEDVDLE